MRVDLAFKAFFRRVKRQGRIPDTPGSRERADTAVSHIRSMDSNSTGIVSASRRSET
ncbi:hypothetical protein ASZ90_010862 [hydrocarbon metagenome]|uniref:Uncharacterized protein n=1 Tax=hydrocarbon metagenome TaxID=938273 RepID=A0A0W8FEU7_9ZZZZ